MDLELDPEQLELEDHARAVLEEACPPTLVRAVFDHRDTGEQLWRTLVELGWPTISAPEALGGMGMGIVGEAILAKELGRAVAPVPYLATITQFAPMLAEAGNQALLRQVHAGTLTGALGLEEAAGCRPGALATTATLADGRWQLTGQKIALAAPHGTDLLAVVARTADSTATDGLGAFLVDPTAPSCTLEAVPSLDATTPLATVQLAATPVDPDHVLLDPRDPASGAAVERVRHHATAVLAISCVGTCRKIFELTLDYAKARHQFGQPIGRFQAIKHRLADAYLAVERAEALCWYAILCVDASADQAPMAVAMAKAAAGECRRLITRDGLQLHGAIGYTWEHDLHFWLKRATVTALQLGDVEAHHAELTHLLGLLPAPLAQAGAG